MWAVLILLISGEFDSAGDVSWEAMARPWMTREEARLYDSLSQAERALFQGTFLARRAADPTVWPATGAYLPAFQCPKPFGDIRDQITYALGAPASVTAWPTAPDLPSTWHYDGLDLHFEVRPGGKVALASRSADDWDRVKAGRIVHADLRYDLSIKSFGRTRLPEDVDFMPVDIASSYLMPRHDGAMWRVYLPIPDAYKSHLRSAKVDPVQHMELLVTLNRPGAVAADGASVRHAGRRVNLMEDAFLSFDIFLPAGFHDAQLQVYSGYLKQGLSAQINLAVLPADLPRIGDPIVSYQWTPAGIEQFGDSVLTVGDQYYKPAAVHAEQVAGRVLVHSPYADTRVLLQQAGGSRALEAVGRSGDWAVFALPAVSGAYRLLSLGYAEEGPVALGATGDWRPDEVEIPGLFGEEGKVDYLSLEQLHISAKAQTALLFVNDRPYLGTRDGVFPWRGIDWGKTATLRFELGPEDGGTAHSYKLRRNAVFESIEVKPKYLVVGTRKLDGTIEAVDTEVTVLDNPVRVTRRTPLSQLPRLWGVVVNDPLLKSAAWPRIKGSLKQWLRTQAGPADQVYVVHNGRRPTILLEPTTAKAMVDAALDGLQPESQNENYFTVQYLIDALTHLPGHNLRPHQVLLLTNGLTDEVKQMEDLIPKLRGTGLQLYNLVFPFDFDTAIDPMTAPADTLALETMAAREAKRARYRENMKNNIQDDRDGVLVGAFSFGKGKTARKQREARIRREAFVDAFNNQLATLTAGLSHTSASVVSDRELASLFASLTAWQEGLVHLTLSVPFLDADMVKPVLPEGYSASWTLVDYSGEPRQTRP